MRTKMMLAALMVGSLVLAGCSGNDNENPPTLSGTGTASTALLDRSDAVITDKNGTVVTSVKVAGGKYHFNNGLLKAENAPFTVSVTGGVMLNGANSPFTGPLMAVTGVNNNIDVNIATQLASLLFKKLPAAQQNVGNIEVVKTMAGQVISAMIVKVYGVAPNMNAVFGPPSAYSEQVLLALMGGTLALQDSTSITAARLVSLEQSANLSSLVNLLVAGSLDLTNSAGFLTTVNTVVNSIPAAAVTSIKNVVADVLATNLPAMVSAGMVTQAVATAAINDAKAGNLTAVPAGTPAPALLFSSLLYAGNASQVISEWQVNNSSANVSVMMKGSIGQSGTTYNAASLSYNPAISGLAVTPASSAGYFTMAYNNASTKITTNQSTNVVGTFPGQAGVYSASTLYAPLKVVYNGSADAKTLLKFVNASITPVELP